VGKFSFYNISLRSLPEGNSSYDYLIDNEFFKLINDNDSDLKRGKVNVILNVQRKGNIFDMKFELNGNVFIPCDRCLDDIQIEILSGNRLIVKFGKEYSEESDEIVIIPETEGEINVAWFLYEFISLSIPMKHVHPPGQCNKMMTSKLNKHRAGSNSSQGNDDSEDDMGEDEFQEDDSAQDSDSRWDSLKNISYDE